MVLTVVLIIAGVIIVAAIFQARAKNRDSNGPMNNN
ncbi:MAG: hypothetical protein JWO09_3243 [Bacteroidetes bacterium]|nr:hypothetical protein [Bacteroidota bacterium]